MSVGTNRLFHQQTLKGSNKSNESALFLIFSSLNSFAKLCASYQQQIIKTDTVTDEDTSMLKNTENNYGLIAIVMHWVSVLLVFGLFGVGWWMVELDYYSEWYRTAPYWHKSIGLLFATFIIFRLLWKAFNRTPKGLGSTIEKKIAKLAHAVLYALMLAIFFSGYLISTADGRGIDVFDWFTVPGFGEFVSNQEDIAGLVHEYLAYGLITLVVLHAIAALKHHFIDKDEVLIRMLKVKTQAKTK